jgi:putative sugar O-methyltransferase
LDRRTKPAIACGIIHSPHRQPCLPHGQPALRIEEFSRMAAIDAFNAMVEELKADDPIFLPSAFWQDLGAKNVHMLDIEGLANFKRTVSQNYFSWFIDNPLHPLFRHAFNGWCRHPNLLPFVSRLRDTNHLRLTTSNDRIGLTRLQQNMYRLYVSFVWTIMIAHDPHRLQDKVAEPKVGNPFRVTVGDRLLSQDLANSIIECNLIASLPKTSASPRIAEVGAGYGRVAHTYLSALPGQYFIFDIPPALGVAQWYLEQTLGPDRVFRFRHFDRIEDVKDEMEKASAVLLTPNQVRKFPDFYFDIMLTISTLPEMRQDQVDLYLSEFQRLSRGHIFIKQWKSWKNPTDGTDLTADSYRLGSNWRLVLDQTDAVIPLFFNRAWSRLD